MEKNPLVHRLIRDKKAEIFHSSTYARAQNGSVIGAASTESFAARQAMELGRKNIRKYNDSLVAERRFNPEGAGANGVAGQSGQASSGQGNFGKQGGPTANLMTMAEKRAERSARFADPLRRPGAGTGASANTGVGTTGATRSSALGTGVKKYPGWGPKR